MAHYKTLLEREKELIKGKATYDGLVTRKDQIESAIALAESAAKQSREKKAAITLMKIGPLAQALERAAELAGKHAQYEAATAQLAELEKLLPEYTAARDDLTRWQAETERTDRDYREARTRIEGRIASLKGKVELLKDSGCSGPGQRYLQIPCGRAGGQTTRCRERRPRSPHSRQSTRSSARRTQTRSLRRKRLLTIRNTSRRKSTLCGPPCGSSRPPKRSTATSRPSARSWPCWKNGRRSLRSPWRTQRQPQKRAGQSWPRSSSSSKRRRHTAGTTTSCSGRSWRRAAGWTKRSSSPWRGSKKAAAAQRILELSSELTEIEEEIKESRAELADEQGKTVGREELQAQVDAAEAEVKAVQQQAQELSLRIGGLQAKLGQVRLSRKQAAELQEQMNELGGKAAGYEELKKAFSQDGIPHNIIRSIIPVFEATATNILGQMSQGRMSVEFVTEKVLKSNSKKEVTTLDIIINDTDTGGSRT